MPIESSSIYGPIQSIFEAWRAIIKAASQRALRIDAVDEDPESAINNIDRIVMMLSDLGAPTDEETVSLVEYLSRAGVPITLSSVSAARSDMASSPEASHAGIALATSLEIPRTPTILNAISKVAEGFPAPDTVPTDIRKRLTAVVDPDEDANETGSEISSMIGRLSLTAERRIATREAVVDDPRIDLLSMPVPPDIEGISDAEALARHIEGQQLLNTIKPLSTEATSDIYFAFYVEFEGDDECASVEIKVARDERAKRQGQDNSEQCAENTPPENVVHSTIRIALPSLGVIEAEISADNQNSLECRLRAEERSTVRLLRRRAPDLTKSLTSSGWNVQLVDVAPLAPPTPLWRGGEALATPRQKFAAKA